jgi:hypothetical protein
VRDKDPPAAGRKRPPNFGIQRSSDYDAP